MALIYATIFMAASIGIISLAVDVGRVTLAKTQLRRLADAAALYAARGLDDGTAVQLAQYAAAEQFVDVWGPAPARPTSFTLRAEDVVSGNCSNGVFSPGASPTNAVQVTAVCLASRGTGIPLMFARIFGTPTCDIHAVAIATCTDTPPGGFVGYNGITAKNAFLVASYNSSLTTSPNANNASQNGALGSNGSITGKNSNEVEGQVILAPGAAVTGFTVTGGTVTQTLVPQTPPIWNPGVNPAGVSSNYTVSGTVVLPGGSYWFTSLTINGSLSFTGPATIYLNGPLNLVGDLVAANSIPSNLQLYGYNSQDHIIGDGSANSCLLCAQVHADTCNFLVKNSMIYCGSGFYNTITLRNTANFYYDEASGAAIDGKQISLAR